MVKDISMKEIRHDMHPTDEILTKAYTPKYRREEIRAGTLAGFDVQQNHAPHENEHC